MTSTYYSNEAKDNFCWTFTKKGYCNKGDMCPWVHPTPEIVAAAESTDQVCRGWVMHGSCDRGQSCQWAHPVNQVPVWVPIEMMSPTSQSNSQQGPMRPMLLPPWVAQVCGGGGEFSPYGSQEVQAFGDQSDCSQPDGSSKQWTHENKERDSDEDGSTDCGTPADRKMPVGGINSAFHWDSVSDSEGCTSD